MSTQDPTRVAVISAANSRLRYVATIMAMSVTLEETADTLVWLATPPEAGRATSGYYYQRKAVPPSATAQDERAAERRWVESEALVAEINVARTNVAPTHA